MSAAWPSVDQAAHDDDGADVEREVTGLGPIGAPARAEPVAVHENDAAEEQEQERYAISIVFLADRGLILRLLHSSSSGIDDYLPGRQETRLFHQVVVTLLFLRHHVLYSLRRAPSG